MRMRQTQTPSVYFQIWDADIMVVDGLVNNLGEAQTTFIDYLKENPKYKLKAYHLVRANVH